MKIGLVTCSDYPQLPESEQFLFKGLEEVGLNARPVVWSSHAHWQKFDALVIRSTWDYHTRYREFINWLNTIKDLDIPVINSVDLIVSNSNKTYLKDIEKEGVEIVPTELLGFTNTKAIQEILELTGWPTAVLKPTISATAYQTYLIREIRDVNELEIDSNSKYLLQPFIPEIINGEYSLIFFHGEFSHAILKKPKAGDFRVQSDFGGSFEEVNVSPEIVKHARRAIGTLSEIPCYARVDGIIRKERFILMELELIEPELFLVSDKLRKRFVTAISEAVR